MSADLGELIRLLLTKRKIFVSYHHALDQRWHDAFSTIMTEVYDSVTDNSLERALDSDDPEYVMRRIREKHITGTSCTVVLCGFETPWRKYVDWEIKATLDKNHGLVGVALPSAARGPTGDIIVPGRLYDNIETGYAAWVTWADVLKGAAHMKMIIEGAIGRSPALINNSRPMLKRNGQPT